MTTWSPLPESVTRRVRAALSGAPRVKQDNLTISPVEVCWIVTNGQIGRTLLKGDLVAGQGSRSGGVVVLTYDVDKQPPWLEPIMREVFT